MSSFSIITEPTLPADVSDSQDALSLVPEQPTLPRLGNFDSIFTQLFAPGENGDASTPPGRGEPRKASTEERPSPPVGLSHTPHWPLFDEGLLSGLDLSTIESPSQTPVSLLLDTSSQDDDDSGQESNATELDDMRPHVSARRGLGSGGNVQIVSASTSPSAAAIGHTCKSTPTMAAARSSTSPPKRLVGTSRSPNKRSRDNTGRTFVDVFDTLSANTTVVRADLPYAMTMRSPPPPPSAWANHPLWPGVWQKKADKLEQLKRKLAHEYAQDRELEKESIGGSAKTSSLSADTRPGIHVFVDLSNITIGFYECIKAGRKMQNKPMKAPPFFFEAFTHILERGRTAKRRVTAGSTETTHSTWPQYMKDAEELGYEMNILVRVAKAIDSPKAQPLGNSNKHNGFQPSHKKNTSRNNNNFISYSGYGSYNNYSSYGSYGNGNGYINYSSVPAYLNNAYEFQTGHHASPTPEMRAGEQAVDEVLHLKMCHSVLDYDDCGTIVLATGDAKEAEFSDGFLKHVERALNRGWCVELLAWKVGISNAWHDLAKQQKETGRFRIIELDKYAEDLLGMYYDDYD